MNAVSFGNVSTFWLENCDLPSRLLELATQMTQFDTGRNYYLLAGRSNTISLGVILIFRSENDAIFWEKFSTSGLRIHKLPTSGQRRSFSFQKFQLSGWKSSLKLNPATENLAIIYS